MNGFGFGFGFSFGTGTAPAYPPSPFVPLVYPPITDFATLIAHPSSKKTTLAELLLGERLSGAWVQQAAPNGNVYALPYLYEDIPLTSGHTSRIVKNISSMKSDGVALTTQTSIAAVQANPNSYWHDAATATLYLHATPILPTAVPNLIGYFTLGLSDTPGMIFNSRYYEPYLLTAPSIRTSGDSVLSGHTAIGGGSISFANGDGFFDAIYEKFIWTNRWVRLLYGGEALPYAEYEPVFTGAITDKTWNSGKVTVVTKTVRHKLQEKIPAEVFTVDAYPNLDQNQSGHSIPIIYGVLDQHNALLATAIDTAFAVDQVQLKLTSHALDAVNAAWVDYGDGAGQQQLSLDANLATANSYTVESLANSTIIVRFAAGGYKRGTTKVLVAASGKQDSATNLMLLGAEMVEDMLVNHGSFATAELNSAAFTQAKQDADFSLGYAITEPTRIIDLVDRVANSEIGRFQIQRDGLLSYSLWVPERQTTMPLYDETDLIGEPTIDFKSDEHFTSVRVAYSKDYTNRHLFELATNPEMKNRYDNSSRKTVETYLTSAVFAKVLAGRLLILHETPQAAVSGSTKWRMAKENLGGKLKLNLPRAPSKSGAYNDAIFELISLVRDSQSFLVKFVALYLPSIATTVGIYTDDAAPNFDAATEDERLQSGFYTDDDGYASASRSPESYMTSRYW